MIGLDEKAFRAFFGMEAEEDRMADQCEVPTCVDPEDTETVIDALGDNFAQGSDAPKSDIDFIPEELQEEIDAIEASCDMDAIEITDGEFDGEVGTPGADGGLDLNDDTEVSSDLLDPAEEYAYDAEIIEVTGNGETVDEFLREEFDQIEREEGDIITDDPDTTILTPEDVDNLKVIGEGAVTPLEEAAGVVEEVLDTEEALPGVGEMTGTESEEIDVEETEETPEVIEEEEDEESVEDEEEVLETEAEEVEESEEETDVEELQEEMDLIDAIPVEIKENDFVEGTKVELGEDPEEIKVEAETAEDAFVEVSEIGDVNVPGGKEAIPLEGEAEQEANVVEEVLTDDVPMSEVAAPEEDEISTDEDGVDTEEQVDEVEDAIVEEQQEPEVIEEEEDEESVEDEEEVLETEAEEVEDIEE